jgi:hypothetical protein
MGLLDDAIKEHLDLKRRRGADPVEVEQAEREALGPVRRDPFEQSDDELEPSAAGLPAYDQDGDVYEDDPAEEPVGDQTEWADAALDERPLPEEPLAEAPIAEAPVTEAPLEEEFLAEELLAEEPEAERPAAAAPDESLGEPTQILSVEEIDEAFAEEDPVLPPSGAGAETVEYDVEQALDTEDPPLDPVDPEPPAEPAEGAAEDVLEETPEFLQDTPDHDRLWFEQRPPKDFDFDG